MQRVAFILISGWLIAACASAPPIDPYIAKLLWLNTANAQVDANQAIASNDLRLLGLATRSISIPGVAQNRRIRFEQACGVRLLDGVSDVIRSDEHLQLMQKARSYALQYNAIIKTVCQP